MATNRVWALVIILAASGCDRDTSDLRSTDDADASELGMTEEAPVLEGEQCTEESPTGDTLSLSEPTCVPTSIPKLDAGLCQSIVGDSNSGLNQQVCQC